jgi:hypothetical protein
LVKFLNGARATFRGLGRTYHGGREKFEPREMKAIEVPPPDGFAASRLGSESRSGQRPFQLHLG